MADTYCKFMSVGEPTTPEQCTTRWPESVSCRIPLGGTIDTFFYNIMVMSGNEADLSAWITVNHVLIDGTNYKIETMTRDEANALGQAIIPPGTEREFTDPGTGQTVTMVAGEFDVDTGVPWTLKP